jgi:hypothetical protein
MTPEGSLPEWVRAQVAQKIALKEANHLGYVDAILRGETANDM